MGKQVFRRWDVSQGDFFPPTYKELVDANHLVHFVRQVVVEDLDLSAIYAAYTSTKGQPPYDRPRTAMPADLPSSCVRRRRIEIATPPRCATI